VSIDLRGRQLQGGKYELLETIAQGGMATVYTAQMRALETTVAVKILAPRFAENQTFRERFRAEAHMIAALHHPNIIEVYDLDEDGPVMYIAMRYVSNGTLRDYLRQIGGPIDLNLAAKLVAQVASALQCAHDAGVVHQDIKPANILLGGADWPLLSDFGIAGWTVGEVVGTPQYMSPEQWEGVPLDGRADQYALALVFYQLVAGRLPFQTDTISELKTQHLTELPPSPREFNPGVPGPVDEVLQRALSKPREHRFPRIEEFATALVESVERSRGMQLETKQAIVDATPNLVAAIGVALVTPELVGLANPNLPVIGSLTLNWPILLILALIESALLLGIRWHLVGILGRLFSATIDGLDRITRMYVRLGTDVEGPLRVQRWRNSIVGSAEGIVGIAYVFALYQIIGPPLIQTIALAVDYRLEPLIATAVAALVLLLAGANVLAIWRTSGSVLGTSALALCWAFIAGMPTADRPGWGGISLQWSAKLVIGLLVVGALFRVRKDVQNALRQVVVSFLDSSLGRFSATATTEHIARQRLEIERSTDALVDVLFFLIAYPILATPLKQLLPPLIGPLFTATFITLVVIGITILLVNYLRGIERIVLPTIGLLMCTPMLLGLPLFDEAVAFGPWAHWVPRCLIGLAILALLLGIRSRVRAAAQLLLVPVFERQISAFKAPKTEQDAEARVRLLRRLSNTLVDLLYVITAYVTVIAPLLAALDVVSLGWVTIVVVVLLIIAAGWYIVVFQRRVAPAEVQPALVATADVGTG